METEVVTGEIVTTGVTDLSTLDFKLINPTEGNFLRKIEWNQEEMMAVVKAKVSAYQNLIYTDETIKQAKADRAELNNLVKKIEDGRKRVKSMVNEPYAIFEAELKEITQVIKDACEPIDRQVKEYEIAQKERKQKVLEQHFTDSVGNLADMITFDKVFDPRYLNATYSIEKAKTEITEKLEEIKRQLDGINLGRE